MKGILLISHGKMAEGLADSAALFFGDEIAQMEYLCLREGDSSDEFGEKIGDAVCRIDSGEGVIILADLYGGTPCNQAIPLLKDGIELISGMNLGIVVQLLSGREYGSVDPDALVESGRGCITNVKKALAEAQQESKGDWFN